MTMSIIVYKPFTVPYIGIGKLEQILESAHDGFSIVTQSLMGLRIEKAHYTPANASELHKHLRHFQAKDTLMFFRTAFNSSLDDLSQVAPYFKARVVILPLGAAYENEQAAWNLLNKCSQGQLLGREPMNFKENFALFSRIEGAQFSNSSFKEDYDGCVYSSLEWENNTDWSKVPVL
jgi:hypothetical protein